MATLEKAIQIALHAHMGQKDLNGQPYILHPLRVMMRLSLLHDQITAVLHDVIEDSDMTLDYLQEQGFNDDILHAVQCITKKNDEPYDSYLTRVRQNPIALRVKIADLEDNMDIRRMSSVKPRDIERLNKYLRAQNLLMQSLDE